jgi:hypothetical protein
MNDMQLIASLIGKNISPGANLKKTMDLLNRANPDEIRILADAMRLEQAQQHFVEVMRGAHVEIFDGNALYHAWRVLRSASSRKSSHRSEGAQYQVVGPFCTTILFGKRGNVTWLQLEEHPWGGITNSILHGADFFQYKVSGKNQGPLGSSKYVESYPLRFYTRMKPSVVEVPRTITSLQFPKRT